jgi:hypothetical protein
VREIPRPGGTRERIVLDYKAPARLLSLDGRLFRFTIGRSGNPTAHSLWIEGVEQPNVGGMSGSLVVAESGSAIGLICTSSNQMQHGPNARLLDNLPGWLLRQLAG